MTWFNLSEAFFFFFLAEDRDPIFLYLIHGSKSDNAF